MKILDVFGLHYESFIKHATFFPGGTNRPRDDGTMMIVADGGMYELKDRHITKWT